MAAPQTSPPDSPPSSTRSNTPLSISLTNIPPLTHPSPPTNTLLITSLTNPTIFTAPSLSTLRTLFTTHTTHGLHAFSPLRSFQRIVLSFYTVSDALHLLSQLSNTPIMGCVPRIYFGEPTPLQILDEERFLKAPKSQKMFFISPPPSPPLGWEMRDEGAPNEMVLAEDLAAALESLNSKNNVSLRERANGGLEDDGVGDGAGDEKGVREGRRKSGTTFVFHPEDHGGKEGLPAVVVEDTTGDEDVEEEEEVPKIMAHTARPPVELMGSA